MSKLLELADRVEALTRNIGVRAVPFAEHYAVTEIGEVWSCRRGEWKRLRPTLTVKGYQKLTLVIRGQHKDCRVNRIVAEAFLGPPPSTEHVARHLDDDRSNNNISNIAWGSYSDNMHDAVRNGRSTAAANSKASRLKRTANNSPTRKLCSDQVREIRVRLANGEVSNRLAEEFNVSKYAISLIKSRKSWKTI